MTSIGLSGMLKKSASLAADNPDLGVFAEEPVSLDVFIQDRKFLKNPPLSLVQYNAVRAIERIYYPSLYPLLSMELDPKKTSTSIGPGGAFRHDVVTDSYWAADIPMINTATLQWGKGGGKDHVCRMCSMRIAYLLMCLVSPQVYFNMPEQDTIHLLNVAANSKQAKEAFFDPITRAVKTGWFKGKAEPLVNSITYTKNIQSISGHSDAEGQEGKNLILGIADEIDAFRSKDELLSTQRGKTPRDPSRSAESILKMLRTSAKTRFPETFKVVRISYPRYRGSMIQQLTAKAELDIKKKGKASRHYVSGPLATWDVRPGIKKEDFADDYEDDPIEAAAMYECKPARAMNPYFRNTYAVTSAMVERRPGVIVDYNQSKDTWTPIYSFSPDLIPIQGARYAMHGDLAVTGDRAGISMAHVVKWKEYESVITGEDGSENRFYESRPFVKVDFAITFEADIASDPPREIQIRWARQLAFELVKKGFNIQSFTFDGFESRDSIQILNDKGIPSKRVSTDLSEDPWKTLKDLMNDARCEIPYSELLEDELLSLTKLPNGKVDHLLGGSKDLADSVACAMFGAVELGGQESEGAEQSYYEPGDFTVGPRTEIPFGLVGNLELPRGMDQFLS